MDKPEKKQPIKKEVAPAPVKMSPRLTSLVKKYTELYATIGLFVTRANMYDGVLIIQQAENRATELINVAQHHPQMLKTLERLAESNDYITLGLGHGLMLYAILANHNRIKADPMFLAQLGYHPEQVLSTPPQEGMNGSNVDATNTRQYQPVR